MEVEEEEEEGLMADVKKMSTDEITARARLLDNEIRIMRADIMRIQHEMQTQKDKIKENTEKIKVNKTLPYLVSNVIEILDVDPEELGIEEDGANVDLDSQRKGALFLFFREWRIPILIDSSNINFQILNTIEVIPA